MVQQDGSDRMSYNVEDSDEIFDDDDDDECSVRQTVSCSFRPLLIAFTLSDGGLHKGLAPFRAFGTPCVREMSARCDGTQNVMEPCFVKLTADDIVKEQRKLIQVGAQMPLSNMLDMHVERGGVNEAPWAHRQTAFAVLYYDDQEKLFAKAGISVNGEVSTELSSNRADHLKAIDAVAVRGSSGDFVLDQQTITCQVCLEDFEKEEVENNMSVGRYVQICGGDGRLILDADCIWLRACFLQRMLGSKNFLCRGNICRGQEKSTMICLGSSEILKKYQARLIDSYVNNNPRIKWCPVKLELPALSKQNDKKPQWVS
eukprot:757244-Hanusia_phi.AAC.2